MCTLHLYEINNVLQDVNKFSFHKFIVRSMANSYISFPKTQNSLKFDRLPDNCCAKLYSKMYFKLLQDMS